MKYTASIDKPTKTITIGITILFASIGILELLTFSPEAKIGAFVSIAIMLAIYWGTYVYRVTGYTLTDDVLTIHRPISDVTYSRHTIESVRIVTKEQLKFTIRTFGVGGFWGYFGKFYNSVYGKMTWYVTRRDQMVLIKTDNNTILLSPDDIDSFTKDLEKSAQVMN
ncbi:PH domain-containing protein [Dyadobacter sp. BHUBP1]|uniref:PH domain-containing protein n=1 Tax=Dyadobacter sp. BHUBP1 TaxID=3424178 RepID=UPI003D354D78